MTSQRVPFHSTITFAVALSAAGCTGGGMRIPVGSSYEGGDIAFGVNANLGYGRGSAGNEGSRSGLMGEMFVDLTVVPERHGIGFRGGYQWHYFTPEGESSARTAYTGFHGMAYYIFRPVPRLSLYAGVGGVFSGSLAVSQAVTTSSGRSSLVDREIDSGAFRTMLGVRLLAIKFSETISWSPYIEASWTTTGATDLGTFGGTGVTFGALFTAPVTRRGRGY